MEKETLVSSSSPFLVMHQGSGLPWETYYQLLQTLCSHMPWGQVLGADLHEIFSQAQIHRARCHEGPRLLRTRFWNGSRRVSGMVARERQSVQSLEAESTHMWERVRQRLTLPDVTVAVLLPRCHRYLVIKATLLSAYYIPGSLPSDLWAHFSLILTLSSLSITPNSG